MIMQMTQKSIDEWLVGVVQLHGLRPRDGAEAPGDHDRPFGQDL
jgi:hypothetical protein